MRPLSRVFLLAPLCLTSCYQFVVTGQVGYSQLGLDGDLGYVNGTSSIAVQQDLQSGFGLGDDQGTPYARASVDLGVPRIAASGFLFSDEGRGQLTANFGGNLTAGTFVDSKFDLGMAKASFTFDIPIGPLTLSPGLAVDFVDLSINVKDTLGIATEDVELKAPLPLGYVHGDLALGSWVNLVAEVGYVQVDVKDINAKLLDIEALVELNAIGPVNLFAGYRKIQLDGDGAIDNDNFDISVGLSGFLIGGGVRF
ncbi:MAG: hypothetical protein U1E73_01065 [Planctomycetota bacterium]